jgi:tetratricopeptide (TPR) repeat protein
MALCVLVLAPGAALADLASAQQAYSDGRVDEALAEVDSLLASDAADPEVRFLKGIIYADQGRDDDAIEIFAALTQDFPELPEPYNNLAVLFAEKGEFEKARQSLLAAIQMHPSYSTAHENLGDLYAKMASLAYDRALEEDAGNESARVKLATVNALFSRSGPTDESTDGSEAAMDPGSTAKPGDPADEVVAAVEHWREAWSARNAQAFVDAYSPAYSPGDMSHAAWEADQRARLGETSFIIVSIDDLQVAFPHPVTAKVNFSQIYEADDTEDHAHKTLTLSHTSGGWQIVREDSQPL